MEASIHETLPCRQRQIKLLSSLFGSPEDAVVSSIFIYGHTGTGKSAVVTGIMEAQQLPHVIVNCIECYTSRLLYEHILNHVSDPTTDHPRDCTDLVRCDNMNDFSRLLSKRVKELELEQQTVYIILEKAERLREMDINLLPAFLRLQQLTDLNLCCILLSEIVWEKFRCGTGFLEPLVVHFPDYTKDELLRILALDCPKGYSTQFYSNYLNLLLGVFHLVCRSLNELRHLALLNFPKYIEPIEREEATEENTRKLWKNIEPHLKKALHTVYLREVSSAQWEKLQTESEQMKLNTIPAMLTSRQNLELPYYSKFLLIAAYLASYNPAKTDRRFFCKASSKTSRRMNLATMKKNERTSNQLLGPKPFPMDRMLAIFYAIVERKVAPTANIFSQITSLVTLQLLSQMASGDHLDAPKFKCLVSLDFIKGIARTVNFEIIRYLYDFV